MVNMTQHKLNSSYNLFLSKLVIWNYLTNKVIADKEQGFNPTKNYEKMMDLQSKVSEMMPMIDELDRDSIKSYFPLVDDVALIQYFKDTVQ
jgi:hypothetical protein